MSGFKLCLLKDKLIEVKRSGGQIISLTLPEVLTSLTRNEVECFVNLQRHQQHAWHAFLVQLATMALHESGRSTCCDSFEWEKMLLALTQNRFEPWCIVVEDPTQPAFLQPPTTVEDFKSYKNESRNSPDQIDVLNTAKNHDVKMKRINMPEPSHWIFALVTLQTMEGSMGRGNYGISRMNGGYGSRPCATYRGSLLLGDIFNEDVKRCLEHRPKLIEAYEFYKDSGGIKLVWLHQWDGKSQLQLSELDPYYIEVCRKVRMIEVDSELFVLSSNTECTRIFAETLKGNTGDPWTPVDRAESKAISITGKGFGYELLQNLLFDEYKVGLTQSLPENSEKAYFWGCGLARGMGKTEGYHDRCLRLPKRVLGYLKIGQKRSVLNQRSKAWVLTASTVRTNVLLPALRKLIANDLKKVMPWLDQFSSRVDQIFFKRFWELIDEKKEVAENQWSVELLGIANGILQTAIKRIPTTSVSFYRVSCAAEGMFMGCKKKRFPQLFDKEVVENEV